MTYTDHKLVFRALKVKDIDKRLSDWKRVKNQVRLADPAVTNKKCSNAVLSKLKVGDHVHRFVIKGRLQLLETTVMKHICFPNVYLDSQCPLCNHPHDNTSHVLNGCMNFRQNYTKRQDRIVNILFKSLANMFGYAGYKWVHQHSLQPQYAGWGTTRCTRHKCIQTRHHPHWWNRPKGINYWGIMPVWCLSRRKLQP